MGAVHRLTEAIAQARENGVLPVVADIKPVSPRDGDLLAGRNPGELARLLAASGVCALSVVTESKHFGGSCAMLSEVARAVELPVLRKDFFSTAEQIAETAQAGAAAVLIILATTDDACAQALYGKARDLGMEAVVEVHTPEELERARALEPTILGINNRNILELETDPGDVSVTEMLAPLVPQGTLILSESSLRTGGDVRRAFRAGADAVLVGTAILQANDIPSCLADLAQRSS